MLPPVGNRTPQLDLQLQSDGGRQPHESVVAGPRHCFWDDRRVVLHSLLLWVCL
jgi:hypothetical protein